MSSGFQLGPFAVSHESPCLIIAEAGVNHNGNMDLAHKLIDEAKAAGANCVKFQSFIADKLATSAAPKTVYQIKNTGVSGNQLSMLRELELSADQQMQLKRHCDESDILYLCTPYEEESVDLLDRMNVAGYKIGSTDTTNLPFLRHVARKGRPTILSSGMCTLGDVEMAIHTMRTNGLNNKVAMLQCVTEYPAPMSDVNLRVMHTFRQAFCCPVGFSDHTQDTVTGSWAAALGACIIEKHFTLNRDLPGPDHRASIEPAELKQYVELIRQLELALGDGIKTLTTHELDNKSKAQKSLVAAKNLKAGQIIVGSDITCKRPGSGLPPTWIAQIIGKKIIRDIAENEVISLAAINFES